MISVDEYCEDILLRGLFGVLSVSGVVTILGVEGTDSACAAGGFLSIESANAGPELKFEDRSIAGTSLSHLFGMVLLTDSVGACEAF